MYSRFIAEHDSLDNTTLSQLYRDCQLNLIVARLPIVRAPRLLRATQCLSFQGFILLDYIIITNVESEFIAEHNLAENTSLSGNNPSDQILEHLPVTTQSLI